MAGQRMPPAPDQLRWQTVVGVVGDVRYRGLLDPRPDIYLPAAQSTMRVEDVLLRTTGDLDRILSQVRAIARELDPGAYVGEVVVMSDALARESAPWRFAMRLLTFFGGLAAVLATVGLVGVVWLVVAMRRRELGVRATLGATPAQLRRQVIADALWTAAAATLAGLLSATALGRAVASFLVGTSPHDAMSLIAAATVALGGGAAGCLLAARGAARTSPAEALRDTEPARVTPLQLQVAPPLNERRGRSPRWKPRKAVRPPAAALAYLNGAMVLGLSLMTDYPGGRLPHHQLQAAPHGRHHPGGA